MVKHLFGEGSLVNLLWRLLQTFGKEGVLFVMFLLTTLLLSTLEFGTYAYLLSIIYLFI